MKSLFDPCLGATTDSLRDRHRPQELASRGRAGVHQAGDLLRGRRLLVTAGFGCPSVRRSEAPLRRGGSGRGGNYGLFPRPAGGGDFCARPAREAHRCTGIERCARCTRGQHQDKPDCAPCGPARRHSGRVCDRPEPLPRPRARPLSDRVAARRPARGRRNRPARDFRPLRPPRWHARCLRDFGLFHPGGGCNRDCLRRKPVLHSRGDRELRGDRRHTPRGRSHAGSEAVSGLRPRGGAARGRRAGRGLGARARAGLGEFGATLLLAGSLQGSRRPFRLRSMRNSRCPSTRRWRSARSSSSSASRSC